MAQEIIDIGNVPGDGTGDPLRTAMEKINTNFDQVWTAGPVGSNVKVSNLTISTQVTNSDLTLAGNGIGNVQSSGSFVPRLSNTWSLGSSTQRWKDIYTKDLVVANNFTTSGNLQITGNVTATYFIGDGSQLSNIVSTYGNANVELLMDLGLSSDIIPSANAVYSLGNATNQWANIWVAANTIYIGGVALGITGNTLIVAGEPVLSNDSNTAITTTGNITATYFIGDGSLLTGIVANAAYAVLSESAVSVPAGNITGLSNVATTGSYNDLVDTPTIPTATSNLTNDSGFITASVTGNFDASGNVTANYFVGDGSQLTGLPESYGNADVATFLSDLGSNTISTTGNISAGNVSAPNFLGNISAANVVGTVATATTAGTVTTAAQPNITSVGALSSLSVTGNITGGNILTDNYLYANGDPFSAGTTYTAGNGIDITSDVISVDANVVLTSGSQSIETTGNVTAANFIGNISITGNVTGTSSNVELVAGSYSYVFDNTGNTAFANGTVSLTDLSATGNITGNTAGFAIGYRDIPQVAFTGNVTMAAADAGKHYYSTQSANYILTIANNTSVGWSVGTAITVVNRGTGNMTIAQGSGVSLYLAGNNTAGNRTVTTYGMATVLNVAANVWMINGTGVS